MIVENILFDLDGTLIDSSKGIKYAVEAAVSKVVPQAKIPDLRPLIGPPIRQVLLQILDNVEIETLQELERDFRVAYNFDGWRQSVAYQGVRQTISDLCQLKVKNFVVTNKPIEPSRNILQHLQLNGYFDDVISPDSRAPCFTSKTESTAYAIAKHELDPEKTILVGDSTDDAKAAAECNLKFVAVTYGYGKAYLECDYSIFSIVCDFPALLNIVIK